MKVDHYEGKLEKLINKTPQIETVGDYEGI